MTIPTTFPAQRTAIVTGAGGARGIGRHVARRLANEGWAVVAVDIDGAAIAEFAEELAATSEHPVLGVGLDISDETAVAAAFDRIAGDMPALFAMVNLAGVPGPTPFMELTAELWDRNHAVNARGSFLMTQHAARLMIGHGQGGRIVNTTSLTAFDGGGTFSKTSYAASKASVIGLTRGASRELGPHGITVNAISPGPVDTDIMGGRLTEERKAAMSAGIPLGRVAQPEEVAALCSYLVSEEAGYTSGDIIGIHGGKYFF